MGNSSTKRLADRTKFDKQEVKRLRELFESVIPSETVVEIPTSATGEPRRKRRARSFSRNTLKDDSIDREQFKRIFQHCCGVQDCNVDLDKVYDTVDVGRKGRVSFTDVMLWLNIYKKGTIQDKLRHIFQTFDTDRTGTLQQPQIERVLEILKTYFEKKGRRIDAAYSLIHYLEKDGVIPESEWVLLGEQTGLIQAILGDEFLEMMDRFMIPGSERKEKKQRPNPPSVTEGDLAFLLPELRREIISHLDDFQTLICAMRVNRRWKVEMEQRWYELCREREYLDYEDWWRTKGKHWKWIFMTKYNTFKREDLRTGIGKLESPKAIYEGEWSRGRKCGWGKITWKVGGFYLGQWNDDFREGYGFQVYSGHTCEGDTYEGRWVQSNREGKGTYHWKLSGDTYIGDWKRGKKEGKGVFLFAKSGNKYEGAYSADKRNGKGTFYWANGDVYIGNWYNGEKQGHGSYTWASKLHYIGGWKRNLKTGHGVMIWPNGCKFEGMWNRNRINGHGAFIWPDGDRYEGDWVNNCRNGKGVLHTSKGKIKVEQDWDEQTNIALADMRDIPKILHVPEDASMMNI